MTSTSTPEFACVRWNNTPKIVPSTTPMTAPTSEIVTASRRTMERNCERARPTARSRPISRVRSMTDSASVLMMPSTAMTMARPSRP